MLTQHHSRARALVGGAACELHFTAGSAPSLEFLRAVTRIVEPEDPERVDHSKGPTLHQITSADGRWVFFLGPSHAALKTRSVREPEHFLDRVYQLAAAIHDFLQTSLYRVVRLQYLNAVPVQSVKPDRLFRDWASALNEVALRQRQGFAQSISGVFDGGQYVLRYGIRPVDQEPFYLSDAIVSVSDVQAADVGRVLSELGAEGVRLLALPITHQALRSIEHLYPKTVNLRVDEWLHELWQSSPGFEATLTSANAERLELLARKYGDEEFSSEDVARLDALAEQVQRLIPRVTERDWQRLDEITSRLDETETEVDQIRRKYRLHG
jgi:hypothetical protein